MEEKELNILKNILNDYSHDIQSHINDIANVFENVEYDLYDYITYCWVDSIAWYTDFTDIVDMINDVYDRENINTHIFLDLGDYSDWLINRSSIKYYFSSYNLYFLIKSYHDNFENGYGDIFDDNTYIYQDGESTNICPVEYNDVIGELRGLTSDYETFGYLIKQVSDSLIDFMYNNYDDMEEIYDKWNKTVEEKMKEEQQYE